MSADPTEAEWADLVATANALPPAVRKAAAAHWSRVAQLEHASIASFSRFTLDLLAMGAPPQLIDGAHRAGLDELRHAKLTFGVASAYAGAGLGPGPLPLDARAFDGRGPEQIVCSAIVEGCIGETVSAFEAQLAHTLAKPAALKAVFAVIAEEEGRHAELAFRFAAWALQQDKALVGPAQRAAEGQLEALRAEPMPAPDAAWALAPHGAAEPASLIASRKLIADESIRPALAQLFSR